MGYRREDTAQARSSKGQHRSGNKEQQPNMAWNGVNGSTATSAKELNVMICKAADRGGLQRLLDVCAQHVEAMTCVNLSTALHKLARLAKDGGSLVSPGDLRLLALHAGVLAELKRQESGAAKVLVRCLSTFAWSYATMNVSGLDVDSGFEIIGRVALAHLDEFNPLELTNLLWGFAKIRHDNKELFETASSRLEADLTSFSSSNLSTLAWAYVTSQQHKAGVLHLLAEGFASRLQQEAQAVSIVKPVELVNMLWSLATAGVKPKAWVLRGIGNEVVQQLPSFKIHQELSIAAWALSRLQVRFDSFFVATALCLSSSEAVWQKHPQVMANLLWAFERQQAMGLDVQNTPHLREALEAQLPVCWQLLPRLSPQEFACVFAALAKLPIRQGPGGWQGRFLADAARRGITLLPSFTERHCGDLVRAFAELAAAADSIAAPEVILAFLDGLTQAAPQTAAVAHATSTILEAAMAQMTMDSDPRARSASQPTCLAKVTCEDVLFDHYFSDLVGGDHCAIGQDLLFLDTRWSQARSPRPTASPTSPTSLSGDVMLDQAFKKIVETRHGGHQTMSWEPLKVASHYPQRKSSTPEPANIRSFAADQGYSHKYLSEPTKVRCAAGSYGSASTYASSSWGPQRETSTPTSAKEILSSGLLLQTPPGLETPPGLPAPAGLPAALFMPMQEQQFGL